MKEKVGILFIYLGFFGVCKNPKPILVFGAKCSCSFPTTYFCLFSFAFGKVILKSTQSWGFHSSLPIIEARPHFKSTVCEM